MKLVTAIIHPSRFEIIERVVTSAYVHGLTVTDVAAAGHLSGHQVTYRGTEYETSLVPHLRIEIAVDDDEADRLVDAIVKHARGGESPRTGDGRIFVTELEEVMRIRTGEVGPDAL